MTMTLPAAPVAPSAEPAVRPATTKVERLNAASVRRVLEPEEMFDWSSLGSGQIVADELLTTVGLDLDLTAEQKARLSREEVAAMLSTGIRFEAALMAGFSLEIATADDLVDPRITYMLHEMGEETRHSRAFSRLVGAIGPKATDPFRSGVIGRIADRIMKMTIGSPAVLYTMVLAGEEIPDLLQKVAAEHPETDPLLAAVNRYHRQEEARHLSYARLLLAELWPDAPRRHRFLVRHAAPWLVQLMFEGLVHPGVYRTVGLPGWRTWRQAHRSATRLELRHEATRPVVEALRQAGVFRGGRPGRAWRAVAGL